MRKKELYTLTKDEGTAVADRARQTSTITTVLRPPPPPNKQTEAKGITARAHKPLNTKQPHLHAARRKHNIYI